MRRKPPRLRFSGREIEVGAIIYAAVLPTVAFGWQVWQQWQERPALTIEMPDYVTVFSKNGIYEPVALRIGFINSGRRPITAYGVNAVWNSPRRLPRPVHSS